MDVQDEEEEKEMSSAATSLPRFELVQTIVTAIGRSSTGPAPFGGAMANDEDDDDQGMQYEYVTHLERNCDESKLVAALSSREIKLYTRDASTLRIEGTLEGHGGSVTELAFAPSDPCALLSSSQDGTVRGWDTRTLKQTMKFGQSHEEVWSMAVSYPDWVKRGQWWEVEVGFASTAWVSSHATRHDEASGSFSAAERSLLRAQ